MARSKILDVTGSAPSSPLKTPKILIIDDDHALTSLLQEYLPRFGFEAAAADTPEVGLKMISSYAPELVILDVMLPGKSGFDVCREIRAFSTLPIIMLTARGETSDRIVGLEMGADDYLSKPFEPRELVARIQSVLRRTLNHGPIKESRLKAGELELDMNKATAFLKGVDLQLTQTEYKILHLLMSSAGQTISREQIAESVRGIEWDSLDRTIDVLVSRIRNKLGETSKTPFYLKTMWGEGYRFIHEVIHE